MASEATGVGHEVDSITLVRGAKVSRWYAVPFRIIPALGQRPEYRSKMPVKKPWNTLQEHESRSYLANHFNGPHPHPTIVCAITERVVTMGTRNELTGWGEYEESDERGLMNLTHVFVYGGVKPLAKDSAAESVRLA
jgi:hypothetical protein